MKLTKLALAAGVLSLGISTAHAQTYKTDFSTQVVLAGGGTNTSNTLTLKLASGGANALTLLFPNGTDAASYVLVSDGSGGYTWSTSATLSSLTTTGNTNLGTPSPAGVTGTTDINNGSGDYQGTINIGNNGAAGHDAQGDSSTTNINGNVNFTGSVSIPAGDLNLGLADDYFYIGNSGGTATAQKIGQDVTIDDDGTATVNGSHATTFTATGGVTVDGLTDATAGLTAEGTIDLADVSGTTLTIGNDAGPSTTTFHGKVVLPAGSLSSSSLGLANNDVLIGNASGTADSATVGQDVTFENAGSNVVTATVNGSHATTFTATGGVTVDGLTDATAGLTAEGTIDLADVSGTTLTIGNDAGPSTTTFHGKVVLPAGSLSSSSLGLANNDVLIGNASGTADSATVGQDVTFENAGSNVVTATVNSSNATTFAVVNAETVGKTLGVTGQTTLASTALSNGTVAAATTIALDGLHSYYSLTGGTAVSIGAITGAPAGQILVFVNTGTANFTLTGAGLLGAGTGDVIMTPGGSATLIYDGSNWHLLASN